VAELFVDNVYRLHSLLIAIDGAVMNGAKELVGM
jgi:hypothetical protein